MSRAYSVMCDSGASEGCIYMDPSDHELTAILPEYKLDLTFVHARGFSYQKNWTRDRISHDVSWFCRRFPRLLVVHVFGQLYGVPRALSYQ